jgi:WhiB family transcriptional regulator, redox-sensing transcriptional regulator
MAVLDENLADVIAAVREMSWADRALCAETGLGDAFYPEKGGEVFTAKRICSMCDVRAQCLEWAIEHQEPFGIWGGLSAESRADLRAQRVQEAA